MSDLWCGGRGPPWGLAGRVGRGTEAEDAQPRLRAVVAPRERGPQLHETDDAAIAAGDDDDVVTVVLLLHSPDSETQRHQRRMC